MFEPSASSPPPPPPALPAPSSEGRALRLLHDVRVAQRRSLWAQGALYGFSAALALWLGAALWGRLSAMVFAVLVGVAVALLFGVLLARRRVGDDDRTARRLAELAPTLNLDLLAAVELSKALGRPNDFSPELAKAFLREVDARAARQDVRGLISPKPVQRAAAVALAVLALVTGIGFWQAKRLSLGLSNAFAAAPAAAHLRREPITGDFELTYRYPSYTGLDQRTVSGTNGELTGPAGTEVEVKTRADRDVDAANLIIGDQQLPLQVNGRDLSGSLVLDKTGSYHVAFVDGSTVVAEGPELPIQVQADTPPVVRLTAPLDVLELGPEQPSVTLKFEASDDYGLTTLDLVFKPRGGTEQRLSLKPDDGRTTRGQYGWNVGAMGLKPGGSVTYFLEAQDNDTVTGPKKGVSRTQTITLYSAAEHRREALRKTQALWERLVTHLADRMEAPERALITPEVSVKQAIDEREGVLAGDFRNLSGELGKEREPFEDVISALLIVGGELSRDQSAISVHRRLYMRLLGKDADDPSRQLSAPRDPTYLRAVVQRLGDNLTRDRDHAEKNVLYLEALLDRVKMEALQELAKDLKEDRRELSKLLEEFGRTKDPAIKEQVLQQMAELKQHMMELQQRMSELAKGIRDDFMNREALDEMMQSENLDSKLDEIEKLVKEGKADEALKKMQELSMQMDETLQQLEQASDQADQQADPELAKKYQEFTENLEQTAKQQESLADKTKTLRDKYRDQVKEKIAKQGATLKRELLQKLGELGSSYSKLSEDKGAGRLEDNRLQALRDIANAEQALKANDFDLASEIADKLQERARRMAEAAGQQSRLDEMMQNPAEFRKDSKALQERMNADAKKADEIAAALDDLFPQNGSQLSEGDRQQMGEMAKQQKQLEGKADQLQQQMESLGERAPIFDEDAKQQMKQAGQRMGQATQKLSGRDPSHGYGEQQGALQALKMLQQQMQKNGKGKGGGLPLPMRQGTGGRNRGDQAEKVEIPDDDPNRAPREFRKDVMDAMKQGAPDRYRDQNKRYYEELVK